MPRHSPPRSPRRDDAYGYRDRRDRSLTPPRRSDRRGDRRERSPTAPRYGDYRNRDQRSPPRTFAPRGEYSRDDRAYRRSPRRHSRDDSPPPPPMYSARSASRSPDMDREDSPHHGAHDDLPPPPMPLLVRGSSGALRPAGIKPFDPTTTFAFQSTSRWNCMTCSYVNYNSDACGSCGNPRPAAEQGLLNTPTVDEAPSSRRYIVTNELCFSRMPITITEADLFTGIVAILKECPNIDLAQALRGMKIELSPAAAQGFPSSLAIVSFKDIDPSARIYDAVRKAGQRFLGAKMKIEFSRRSILKLQAQNAPPVAPGGLMQVTVPVPIPAPVGPPPFSPPTWSTVDDLQALLTDIDGRWADCSADLKSFYNSHLPILQQASSSSPAELTGGVVKAVAAEEAPPLVPQQPPLVDEPSPTVKPTTSIAQRLALAKQKKEADAVAAAQMPQAAVVSAPAILRKVLQVVSVGEWPRFNFVSASINGKAVVRTAALTQPAFSAHVSLGGDVVIDIPLPAVQHAFLRHQSAAEHPAAIALSVMGYPAFREEK